MPFLVRLDKQGGNIFIAQLHSSARGFIAVSCMGSAFQDKNCQTVIIKDAGNVFALITIDFESGIFLFVSSCVTKFR